MHIGTHRACGGVVGFYHGDPERTMRAGNFHREDGTTPDPGRMFPERCRKCGADIKSASEIEWKPKP